MTNVLGKENVGVESSSSGSRIPYYPTHTVRIVDFPFPVTGPKKQQLNAEVQLWEIGGDPKYVSSEFEMINYDPKFNLVPFYRLKSIWPGVQKDADGIIILYKTIDDTQVNDASALHMHFLTHSNSGLSPAQCFIIGNNFRGMRELGAQKIIGISQRTRHVAVNVEDDVNKLRDEFQGFISGVAQIVYEKERALGQ